MIIDMHAHLGDICFEGSGSLIERNAVRIVKKACRGDKTLEQRIFHANAAKLLKLEPGARG